MIRVCGVDDVPLGEGRAVLVDGRRIALFNTTSGWFALDAVCPHRAGPLEDGIVSGSTVLCPLHERPFELATGRALGDCADVTAYRVEQVGVDVHIEVEAPVTVRG